VHELDPSQGDASGTEVFEPEHGPGNPLNGSVILLNEIVQIFDLVDLDHRAGRAVRANIAAAAVSIVWMRGVRLGLVRRVRFGASCEGAVSKLFAALPKSAAARLIVVDAGCAPLPPNGKRGRNPIHGPVLHPGRAEPELAPDEALSFPREAGPVRLRRWNRVHGEGHHETPRDVVRVADPSYQEPLLGGRTAHELTTEELWQAYPHRWPVETLFYIGAETTATEKPRAWTEQAVERRIGLGLVSGSLLKAIAAMGEGLAMGPYCSASARPKSARCSMGSYPRSAPRSLNNRSSKPVYHFEHRPSWAGCTVVTEREPVAPLASPCP
jgi:hypothetical protein